MWALWTGYVTRHWFSAPFHFVTFSDFWLGDQMNSLATCFVDLQYFICFYSTEVEYRWFGLEVRSLNVTEGPIPWGMSESITALVKQEAHRRWIFRLRRREDRGG